MKIILLGYMGCGKSTIGKLLSRYQNMDFIDLDSYIEHQEKQSVREIFSKKGEIYFRKIESNYLEELLESPKNYILALGGGTPCFGNNMEKIIKSGHPSFYLKYKASTLSQRLSKEKTQRPLISHLKDEELEEFINKHLFERNQYYTKAKFQIIADDTSAEDIVKKIKELVVNHSS